MNTQLPCGLWPVMLTAFDEEGSIDWNGVDALTDWYIDSGAAGLFACCLSSEMYHLTDEERLELAHNVVRRAAGRVPVVATGTFGGAIDEQAEFIKRMANTGVQAVVVIPNQLVKADEPDALLRSKLEKLLAATDAIPLGFYECPSPYKRLLSADLIGWAAHTGRFLYLKDTSQDVSAIQAKLKAMDSSALGLFNAHQPTALESMRHGAAGVSPTAANYYPELFVWLCKHYRDEGTEASELQGRLTIMQDMIRTQYPISAKLFLQQRGLPIQLKCRTTDAELTDASRAMVESLWETLKHLYPQLGIGIPNTARHPQ